jgi:hypothetical protein
VQNVRQIKSDRHVVMSIDKEEGGWWPRLLADKGKVAWVKVDFDKWRDEDDNDYAGGDDAAPGGFDMQSVRLHRTVI